MSVSNRSRVLLRSVYYGRWHWADTVYMRHYGKFIDPSESWLFANPKSTAM